MVKVAENGAEREVWGEPFELDAIAQAGARRMLIEVASQF